MSEAKTDPIAFYFIGFAALAWTIIGAICIGRERMNERKEGTTAV